MYTGKLILKNGMGAEAGQQIEIISQVKNKAMSHSGSEEPSYETDDESLAKEHLHDMVPAWCADGPQDADLSLPFGHGREG